MVVGIIYSRPELERIPQGVLEGVKDTVTRVCKQSVFKPLKFAQEANIYLSFAKMLWQLDVQFEDADPHYLVKVKLKAPNSMLVTSFEYTIDKDKVNIDPMPLSYISILFNAMEMAEGLFDTAELER